MQTLEKSTDCRDLNSAKASISQAQQSPTKLTAPNLADSITTAGNIQHGSRNPFRYGDKAPQFIAAFLCTSLFSAALSRLFIMAGCLGHGSSMAAPYRGFLPLFSPSPNVVENISGGYSSLDMESPNDH